MILRISRGHFHVLCAKMVLNDLESLPPDFEMKKNGKFMLHGSRSWPFDTPKLAKIFTYIFLFIQSKI